MPFYLNFLRQILVEFSVPLRKLPKKKQHCLLFPLNSSPFRSETNHAPAVAQVLPFFSFPLNVNFHLLLTFRRFSLPLLRHYVNASFSRSIFIHLFFVNANFALLPWCAFPDPKYGRLFDRAAVRVRRNTRENSGQPITGPITGDRCESDGRQKCSVQAFSPVSNSRRRGTIFFAALAQTHPIPRSITRRAKCRVQSHCPFFCLFCVCARVCVRVFFRRSFFSHCRELCTRRFRIKW